jgi:hypothetical protein
MNPDTFNRLHSLRMENDAAGYAMQEQAPRFTRIAGRHENGTAPRAVSAFQLFQTPPALAARMVSLLGDAVRGRVLEPSAGLGCILDALAPFAPVATVAVEMAATCAGELFRQERAGVRILQRDFLTVTPEETGLFDAVAMNAPFHIRADVRHTLHARQFLAPGGVLVAICMAGPHRERALRPLAATWEELPPGTFKSEGTGVGAVLLTMKA